MNDVRERARRELSTTMTQEARQAAEEAIDATIYNFMMVADGVIGGIGNGEHAVSLKLAVELSDGACFEVIQHLDLVDGDGACMGFHSWLAGDFGETPITAMSAAD